jgi:DnaJ-class molecular chaperone
LKGYAVDNKNVFQKVELPYYDMLIGVDKEIILPNDEKIIVNVPENSQPDDMVKYKGGGLNGGDYFLCIKPTFPTLKKNDKDHLNKVRNNHK